jgi:hypothetical protein
MILHEQQRSGMIPISFYLFRSLLDPPTIAEKVCEVEQM